MASIIERRLSLHQCLAQKEEENRALKSQNMQLQALANLGSATCMIAHEINNLLTPLANYAALATQNPDDKKLAEKVLDKTVRNCQRAAKIMQSMLAMANGQKQQRETVSAKALIEEVFTCLCRDFNKDRIRVEIQVDEALQVTCIPVQIEQVLMNLILNARDAMLPGGGTLRVSAAADEEHRQSDRQRHRHRHHAGEPEEYLPAVLHHENRNEPPGRLQLGLGGRTGVLPADCGRPWRRDHRAIADRAGKHLHGPAAPPAALDHR